MSYKNTHGIYLNPFTLARRETHHSVLATCLIWIRLLWLREWSWSELSISRRIILFYWLQVSTLTQCYRTQISELEVKLQKESEILKKQLAATFDSAKFGKTAVLDDSNLNPYLLPVIPKDDSDGEMDINVSMIPREEGEVSWTFLHHKLSSAPSMRLFVLSLGVVVGNRYYGHHGRYS